MVISMSWSCARCGAAYISTPPESGICNDCTVVSLREIFYGAARLTLTQDQADCLAAMVADATAHCKTRAEACKICHGSPTQLGSVHCRDWLRIQNYLQLATYLGEAATPRAR
jgi:hypothetical protein